MTNDDIITYGWECEKENTQGDITDCWVNADTCVQKQYNQPIHFLYLLQRELQ